MCMYHVHAYFPSVPGPRRDRGWQNGLNMNLTARICIDVS